jgi:hypothetical protein
VRRRAKALLVLLPVVHGSEHDVSKPRIAQVRGSAIENSRCHYLELEIGPEKIQKAFV